MIKWLSALACIGFASSVLAVGNVELEADHPTNYIVQKGDTLWDISDKFLKSPWKWPKIWQVNQQIANPHLIYPGDILSLVYINGEPKIILNRGTGATVKLSPSIRTTALTSAIPAIPLDKIDVFLNRGRFVEQGELEGKPYVIAGGKRHLVTGAGDQVFARGEFDQGSDSYGIYREEELFIDPETNEVLGLQLRSIGLAQIVAQDSDITTLSVNRSAEEIRIGDNLLSSELRSVSAVYQPSAPSVEVDGVIIGVDKGVSQVGKMSVVVINLGERDHIEEGDVMAIMKTGEVVRDNQAKDLVQLPDQRAGLLMVFRVFDKLSYGLVLQANQGLSVDDKVAMP